MDNDAFQYPPKKHLVPWLMQINFKIEQHHQSFMILIIIIIIVYMIKISTTIGKNSMD